MATQQVAPQSNLTAAAQSAISKAWPVPPKIGIFGPQGAGKSSTTALIAAAYSALFCERAPIAVVDPEAAWGFLEKLIFQKEGIKLIRKPYRSFKGLRQSIKEAEREGCCAWLADPITLHWNELMDTFKGKKGFVAIDQWPDIRQVWGEYIIEFLNTPLLAIAAGRLGNEFDEREEVDSKGNVRTKTVKVGTKFKAGGGESFGYEPHLLIEMSLERKAKRLKEGDSVEGEGRMVHRADILKDRTWALNGKVLRFHDMAGYRKGGYSVVWNAIKPHFLEVQGTESQALVGNDTSEGIANVDGNSEYYEKRKRRDVLAQELHAAMELLWGGNGKEEKRMRLLVFEHIFGFRSKEAADEASLATIERGVRILQAFEKRCKRSPELLGNGELEILAQLDIDIQEYDQGEAEAADLPF